MTGIDHAELGHLLERGAALSALAEAFEDIRSLIGRVIAISGEAGVGKTALVRRFTAGADPAIPVFSGACEDLEALRPLGPLFDMIAGLGAPARSALANHAPFADVGTALVEHFRSSATGAVMVIEDIHWADALTLDLIRFIGRRIHALPLLLIVTFRTDDHDSNVRIARALGDLPPADIRRIALAPLSRKAVAALAEAACQDIDDIYAVTGGNPFFVTEILAAPSADDRDLPASVRDAVWARFGRRSAPEQALMRLLALQPGGAPAQALKDLLDPAAAAGLTPLLDAGVLVELASERTAFRHELARRAVLEAISSGERREGHARIARWYAANSDENDMSAQATRFFHAAAAGDADQVVRLSPPLAAHAAQIGAHRQSAQFLAAALNHVERMDDTAAAQTYESWSYETGLSEQIDQSVIDARHRAIALWRALGDWASVGRNLRWLARLHWYLGEASRADRHLSAAIALLEDLPASDELAWCYSARSQSAMLNDRFDEAVAWGRRALELADRLNNPEVRVHAMNNIGTSLLFSSDPASGVALMEESLALALRHGFHEQAARVYTNVSEYALAACDLDLAAQYLEAGIAFDTENDLDSWIHYLRGCLAQFHLMKGDLRQARDIAASVVALTHITPVMKMGAALVLALADVRSGATDALEALHGLLDTAISTGEPQRIVPVRLALCEALWRADDLAACGEQARAAWDISHPSKLWERGEIACWLARAGLDVPATDFGPPAPFALELRGRYTAAARAWTALGLHAAAELTRLAGVAKANSGKGAGRGPYRHARDDPYGLTGKERVVIDLIVKGMSNREISAQLNRSIRTIEHHASTAFAKLNVANRSEAIILMLNQR